MQLLVSPVKHMLTLRSYQNVSPINNFISCKQLTKQQIDFLLQASFKHDELQREHPNKLSLTRSGHLLVNAFFEPSTRTQLSFEAAQHKLGGDVINFNVDTSSVKKGETHEDTIRSLANYGDIMVIRHPDKGFVEHASNIVDIPVINGGDGSGEHPTQALLDLYTIYKHFKFNDETSLNILMVGDIKHSRTIHSLIDILDHYPNINISLLPYLNRGPDIETILHISQKHKQESSDIVVTKDTCDIGKYDVIYMTRLQVEREFGVFSNNFIIDKNVMKQIKDNAIVMHPLPRNNEILPEVDNDPRCVYFEQMKNGVFMRMTLIEMMLLFSSK